MEYKLIHDAIIDRARLRKYDKSKHQLHHIIPRHIDPKSTETVPLTIKEHWVVHRLRYKFENTWQNKVAYFLLKGNYEKGERMLSSHAGKIGGAKTRANQSGIFSPSYDRSYHSKRNWETGKMDHIDFVANGKSAGAACVAQQAGVHNPKYDSERTRWATLGGNSLTEETRRGCATSDWAKNNPEQQKLNAAKGGSIGGKTTGKMFWWNDGSINKKSFTCPGTGWARGMLMSEKKRKQVYEKFLGKENHNE